MNGTPAAKARRNLTKTSDRAEWMQAHSENHLLRYQLHDTVVLGTEVHILHTGAYNLTCDRKTLLAEIMNQKPAQIERVMQKESDVMFAPCSEHLRFLGELEILEVVA